MSSSKQPPRTNGSIEHYDAVIIGSGVSGMYALHHLRELGFSGLSTVRLHAVRALSPAMVDAVRAIYDGQTLKPSEIVVHAPRSLVGVTLPQVATS